MSWIRDIEEAQTIDDLSTSPHQYWESVLQFRDVGRQDRNGIEDLIDHEHQERGLLGRPEKNHKAKRLFENDKSLT